MKAVDLIDSSLFFNLSIIKSNLKPVIFLFNVFHDILNEIAFVINFIYKIFKLIRKFV